MVATIALSLAITITADPTHYVLNAEAGVSDIAVQDINGDDKAEIFALCCDEESRPLNKFVAAYLADETGAYPPTPTVMLSLDPSIGALFFAQVDGAPPVELVATNAEGATVYSFRSGRFEKTASAAFTSLLPSGARKPLFMNRAAVDLDGDGVDEWLVPVASGFELRNVHGRICAIPCDVVSGIRAGDAVYISHRLPIYRLVDLPGQSQKGLAFLSDDVVDFAYGLNWSEHRDVRLPVILEEENGKASWSMEDIDGNGLPDFLVTQAKGMVGLKVLTQVYLAAAPFAYPDTPTAAFEANGSVAIHLLTDADADGDLDVLTFSAPLGIKSFINYFVRKRVSVHVDVHLFEDGGFPDKPSARTKLTVDAPEDQDQVVYALGDFNGDGHLDVAYGAGTSKLVIFSGGEKRFLASRPWVTLALPTSGDARTCDLDGSGCDDIVLFHRAGELQKRIEVVVF